MRNDGFYDRFKRFSARGINLPERYLIPIKIILVYIAWKVFYPFTTVPGTALNLWWAHFTYTLGSVYASVVAVILNNAGVMATTQGIDIVLLKSNSHIAISEHCLALPAMTIFAGSVAFFKGRFWQKIIFIAIGFLGIVIINVFRMFFVSIAWMIFRTDYYMLNHSVLYVILTYSFIFLMLRWWINRMIENEKPTEVEV